MIFFGTKKSLLLNELSSRIKFLEKRVLQLECPHTNWEYSKRDIPFVWGVRVVRSCPVCGKTEFISSKQLGKKLARALVTTGVLKESDLK